MRSIELKNRLRDRLDIIGLLSFAIVVLFIAFPNLLFSRHVEEIPRAAIYYRYFFAGAFIIFLVLASVSLVLPRRIALVAACILGAYALLVLIFDLVQPLEIGWIEEGTEREPAALVAGAVQVILMVGAFFALLYIPRKVRGVIAWSLAAVLIISGIPFLLAPAAGGYVPADLPAEDNGSAPDFNIYHIVFDAYYGPWLQWSLDELSRDRSELAGFVHYQRCVSNYFWTVASFPSFMSGTMYSPDRTVTEWHQGANDNSLVDDLHERGFSSTFYGIRQYSGTQAFQEAYTEDPGGAQIVDVRLATDYWLLRVSPVALRHLVLDDRGAGPVTRWVPGWQEVPAGDIRNVVSYRQFQQFLADEPLRLGGGQYVHTYFYPPHGPYQLDRHGTYVGESSYEEQLLLATDMLLEIVETLKELGRFENSLIVIHSDHGSGTAAVSRYREDPFPDFLQMDEATSEAIREGNVNNASGIGLEGRYSALLLIKLPGVGEREGELVVNDELVQLLDLRDYVNTVLDKGEGAYPEREEVHIHMGLLYQVRDGERVMVGRDILEGHINHYIIRPGGEWEIADNIPFIYE